MATRSYSEMESTNNQPTIQSTTNNSIKHERAPKRAKYSQHKPMVIVNTDSSSTSTHSTSNVTPQRRDLFDARYDESYAFTAASSTIPPPTLGQPALERVWREKTDRALLNFQRRMKSKDEILAQKEPNNDIMKLLLRVSILETDANLIARLRDCVLTLIYSSQSQQKQLLRPKNRYSRNQPRSNNNMYRYDASWYDKLPGPQPHSITRQNLDRLRSYCYWVTEKSDGIRFMLLLSNTPSFAAYFVDRKFTFYRITHSFYKVFLNDVNGSTLLDGELIVNNADQLEYLAFDCIASKGRSLSNHCTSERIELVTEFQKHYGKALGNYDEEKKEKEDKKDEGIPPIVLRAKKHWKAEEIEELLGKIIRSDDGEYWFIGEKRKTKNDGLIFTPQENNYLMSYDPGALVKWKFLEKNTIDLKVKTPYIWRDRLDLFAGGKGNSDVLFAVIDMKDKKHRTQFEVLLDEMKRLSSNRCGFVESFIIECGWNFDEKQWELIQNRPDKHIANFITVCTDTLRVMMDNVTKQELIDACKPIMMRPQTYQNNNHYNHHSNTSYTSQYH